LKLGFADSKSWPKGITINNISWLSRIYLNSPSRNNSSSYPPQEMKPKPIEEVRNESFNIAAGGQNS
jgi:hypothetical protein